MWHPHGTIQLDYNAIDVTKINHLHMNDYDNDVALLNLRYFLNLIAKKLELNYECHVSICCFQLFTLKNREQHLNYIKMTCEKMENQNKFSFLKICFKNITNLCM
jgi:hypothetical protein